MSKKRTRGKCVSCNKKSDNYITDDSEYKVCKTCVDNGVFNLSEDNEIVLSSEYVNEHNIVFDY